MRVGSTETMRGKREVRIYDYVDLQVPVLERMYHRRLKGYAELGYQVKFGAQDESVSAIYDGRFRLGGL